MRPRLESLPLTDVLCTRCGLCCDGTLFGDVELRGPAEAARLEALGLDVDTDDADAELLALPCAGLRGTRCSVYPQRPQCCRTFECRLLKRAARGQVTVEAAIARIDDARRQVRSVHSMLAALEPRASFGLPLAERVANAIAAGGGGVRAERQHAALRSAWVQLRRALTSTFLR